MISPETGGGNYLLTILKARNYKTFHEERSYLSRQSIMNVNMIVEAVVTDAQSDKCPWANFNHVRRLNVLALGITNKGKG